MYEDVLKGSVFQNLDTAYEIAEAFLKKYPLNTTKWGEDEKLKDFDEEVLEFTESWVRKHKESVR